MDGDSSWARAADDRSPGYADGPGWYGEREEQGQQPHYGGLPDPLEPRPRVEADRYDTARRQEPWRGSSLSDPGVSELPRVERSRSAEAGTGQTSAAGPLSVPPRPESSAPPRRPVTAPASPAPIGDNVYRSKRPAAVALFGAVAAILEIPALVLLRAATFDDPVSASGVVSAVCLVCALPLAAVGLYAVSTGAVRAAGPNSLQAWLRPPVAYLSVALVLFIAAGLAA